MSNSLLGPDGQPIRNGQPKIVGPDGVPADPIEDLPGDPEEFEFVYHVFEALLRAYPMAVWAHPGVMLYYAHYIGYATLNGPTEEDRSKRTFSIRVPNEGFRRMAESYDVEISPEADDIVFSFRPKSVDVEVGDERP